MNLLKKDALGAWVAGAGSEEPVRNEKPFDAAGAGATPKDLFLDEFSDDFLGAASFSGAVFVSDVVVMTNKKLS